ncbi:hypothetical protein GO013_16730, partial [Pseudodesulfovibrio sp. JC047]|uniref:hypothetical protein n=1 Tax=Pseudodesulfovibrio sp. JC047 TaxID=2683199 RepID=UPI0013D5E013
RVEQNIKFDPKPTSLIPSGPIPKPTAPAIDEYLYTFGEGVASGVLFSWAAVKDPRVKRYEAQMQRPGQSWGEAKNVSTSSINWENISAGTYSFRIRSLTATGLRSPWLVFENVILVGLNQPPNDVTNLVMCQQSGQGVIAWDAVVDWRQVHYEIRKGVLWDTAMPLG